MDSGFDFLILFAQFHGGLSLVAVLFLLFSRQIPEGKRIPQLLFAVLIPVLGPIGIGLIYLSDYLSVSSKDRLSERYMGQSIDEHRKKWF